MNKRENLKLKLKCVIKFLYPLTVNVFENNCIRRLYCKEKQNEVSYKKELFTCNTIETSIDMTIKKESLSNPID